MSFKPQVPLSLDRRSAVVGCLSMAALLVSTPLSARTPVQQASHPNVIFIMADDLGYADLSLTGSRHIRTPAIDSIAQNGVQLTQGYANAPICSPTRTALLTGRYQQRFRIGLEEPLGGAGLHNIGLPTETPTIASVFREIGYRTTLIGKWHLGAPPKHGPTQHGYDSFYGIVEGAADYFRHHMVFNGSDVGIGLARDNDPVEAQGYLTDLLGDEAVKTIEGAGKQPFFISLHFNAPHWPWEGREDAEVAKTVGSSFHYEGGNLAKYKEMVEAMDQNVAKVLVALQRSGKADNTIIVFTSDNGGERFSDTWPLVGVKGELLEGGIRVPILMSWKGRIPAQSTSSQVMISMDFLPTLLTMAVGQVDKIGTFDGANLSAQLQGKAAPVDRTLFWREKANGQAAVRDGDWKYLRLGGKEHLFNLAEDQRERAERNEAEPKRLAAMRQKWDEWNAQMLPYPLDSYSEDVRDHYSDRY